MGGVDLKGKKENEKEGRVRVGRAALKRKKKKRRKEG